MQSHEVIRAAANRIGVKALAAQLGLSPALVYKWCQEYDPGNPNSSGTRNPLDRIRDMVRATGDLDLVRWVCRQAGGFLAMNPQVRKGSRDVELVLTTQRVVSAFSDLLEEVTRSIRNDGVITPAEAERIRRDWEMLKGIAETFVTACEQGMFGQPK